MLEVQVGLGNFVRAALRGSGRVVGRRPKKSFCKERVVAKPADIWVSVLRFELNGAEWEDVDAPFRLISNRNEEQGGGKSGIRASFGRLWKS